MANFGINTMYDKEDLKPIPYYENCDTSDYLIAAGCGAIAGLVDIFFVGSPIDSKLQSWTDSQVDKTVMHFAKLCGWSPRKGQEGNINSAIGFLENGSAESRRNGFYGFKVNYDQRHSGDVDGLFKMSSKNHHMKSLAHSPDIIGLFFSIVNQFTSTSSFLHNGQLITIQTENFELQGHDFISKLFCGIANWFGHIMSDIAGSSGSTGRGSGVVIPFYEMFQLCDFGSFQVDGHRNNLATVATKVFEKGYDARFGLTMAIPVVLCDLSIRLVWAIKRFFNHKKPLLECIPNQNHADLRVMLIVGNGTLCLMDGADAAVRSGGNWVNFFLRLNIIAWFKLILMILKEICIRHDFTYNDLKLHIQKINQALDEYIMRLQAIDYGRYEYELAEIRKINNILMDETNNTEMIYEHLLAVGANMQFRSFEEMDQCMMENDFVLEI